jgi:hypothetical protein
VVRSKVHPNKAARPEAEIDEGARAKVAFVVNEGEHFVQVLTSRLLTDNLLTRQQRWHSQFCRRFVVIEGASNMRDQNPDVIDPSQQRQKALSRWDDEGGLIPGEMHSEVPELTNAELVHLRVRVIALENVVIALLAESSQQLDHVREMAAYISPRSGSTEHPLTIHAANHIVQLVERARHFRVMPPL